MSVFKSAAPRRKTVTLIAAGAVALSALAIPLVSQPTVSFAAALPGKGCVGNSISLQILKVDPSGEPLPGATFDVTGDLMSAASSSSPRWAENGSYPLVEAAEADFQVLNAALSAAVAELNASDLALADAQAALEAAQTPSPELAALYEQRNAAQAAVATADTVLADAEADLEGAQFGGDPAEIADSQAAVDAAQADRDAAVSAAQAVEAEIAPLAAAHDAAVADATAAFTAAGDSRAQALSARDAAKVSRDDALEALTRARIGAFGTADATERVTTDADGRATVSLMSPDSGCTLIHPDGTEERLRPELSIPEIVEVEAPAGYQLITSVITPDTPMPGGQSDWTVTIVNEPVEPEEPVEPPAPEDPPTVPEEPVTPTPPVAIETAAPAPLASTGVDLTPMIGLGGLAAIAGAVLFSGPLLRRFTKRRS